MPGVSHSPSRVRVRHAALAVLGAVASVLGYQLLVHGGLSQMDGERGLLASGFVIAAAAFAYVR